MTSTLRVARSTVVAAAILAIVALLTYLVFFLLPADPAQLACGKPCTPDNLARAHEYMGLDKTWFAQFIDFARGVVTGRSFGTGGDRIDCAAPCLGYSFQQNATVFALIGERLPVTLSITVGAAVLWLVVGVGAGLAAGTRPGSWTDRTIVAIATAGLSTPVYLSGLLAIYVFGFRLDVIPVGGYVALSDDPVGWAWHLVTPWLVLAWSGACVHTRLMRSEVIAALGQGYVRTARANGLSERRVLFRHVARNGIVPVFTFFAIEVSLLLGGAVITETVFGMPGLGRLLIDAVGTVDLPVVVGLTVFSAFLVLLANLLIDAVLGLLDPRIGTP